jgi:hypothetical protein
MHILKLTLLAFSVAFGITAQAATTPAKSEPTMSMNSAVLQVSAIDHVGLNVPDIDAATRFFSELVGAKVISDMSPGKIPDQWKTQFRWHGSVSFNVLSCCNSPTAPSSSFSNTKAQKLIMPSRMATTPAQVTSRSGQMTSIRASPCSRARM